MAILYRKEGDPPKKTKEQLTEEEANAAIADTKALAEEYYNSPMFEKKYKKMYTTKIDDWTKKYNLMKTRDSEKYAVPMKNALAGIELLKKQRDQYYPQVKTIFGIGNEASSLFPRIYSKGAGWWNVDPAGAIAEDGTTYPAMSIYGKDELGNNISYEDFLTRLRHEEGHIGTQYIPFTEEITKQVLANQKADGNQYLKGDGGFSETRSDMFSVITDPSIQDIYNGNIEELTEEKLLLLNERLKNNKSYQRLRETYEDKDLIWLFNNLANNTKGNQQINQQNNNPYLQQPQQYYS